MPGGAVSFMKANRLHGNILNSLDWGEYLIWHVTPASHVFIRETNIQPALNYHQPLGNKFQLLPTQGAPGGVAEDCPPE